MSNLLGGNWRPGALLRGWVVACGRCEDTGDSGFGTLQTATLVLRANGWTMTKRYGWLCEACASDMRGGDQ
jgi:hypothetical protein